MSEDVYVLEKAVNSAILYELNMSIDASLRLYKGYTAYLRRTHHGYPTMKEIEDWVSAIESGKKIVNPMSPKEELKQYYDGMCLYIETHAGNLIYPKEYIKRVVKIIAKEHPDVADWLEDKG